MLRPRSCARRTAWVASWRSGAGVKQFRNHPQYHHGRTGARGARGQGVALLRDESATRDPSLGGRADRRWGSAGIEHGQPPARRPLAACDRDEPHLSEMRLGHALGDGQPETRPGHAAGAGASLRVLEEAALRPAVTRMISPRRRRAPGRQGRSRGALLAALVDPEGSRALGITIRVLSREARSLEGRGRQGAALGHGGARRPRPQGRHRAAEHPAHVVDQAGEHRDHDKGQER